MLAGPHVVADTSTLDTGGEVVADLAFVGTGQFVSEEHGDMFGLDDMDGGAHDGLVEGLELGLLAEHHVGGVLHLHEAPVNAVTEVMQHRAEALCPLVEALMQHRRIEAIGETLRLGRIAERDEGIVEHLEIDAGVAQLPCQPAMAVEVDL